MPTSFFDLPRELRDQVYDLAWQDNNDIRFSAKAGGIEVEATYPRGMSLDPKSAQGLPLWLLTNKATLKEGLEQFQREGSLHHLSSALETQLGDSFYTYKPAGYDSTAFSTLLSPLNVRELRLKLYTICNVRPTPQAGQPFSLCHGISPENLEYATRLMQDATTSDALRVLKVSLSLSMHGLNDHSIGLEGMNLIVAPVISKLKHFEMEVSIGAFGGHMARNSVEMSLLEGVKDLSKGLMAGMKCSITDDMARRTWVHGMPSSYRGWVVTWTRA
jgi:hypothetical protein